MLACTASGQMAPPPAVGATHQKSDSVSPREMPLSKLADVSDNLSGVTRGADSLNAVIGAPDTIRTPGGKREHLESTIFRRERPVDYESNGHRDPFRALIADEKKQGEVETDLLKLDGAILTGVVWAQGQYLALVKDKDGKNFFLREGDPVYQGHVTLVTQSQASFELSDFGDDQKVVLKVRAKDKEKG
jgi:hypothetical protein